MLDKPYSDPVIVDGPVPMGHTQHCDPPLPLSSPPLPRDRYSRLILRAAVTDLQSSLKQFTLQAHQYMRNRRSCNIYREKMNSDVHLHLYMYIALVSMMCNHCTEEVGHEINDGYRDSINGIHFQW